MGRLFQEKPNMYAIKITIAVSFMVVFSFALTRYASDDWGLSILVALMVFAFCEWFELAISGRVRDSQDYGREEKKDEQGS